MRCWHRSPCAPESPSQGLERSTCLLPASECPFAVPSQGSSVMLGCWKGVRAVADPGVGKGRRLFAGAGQAVTPAANTGSLSASCPANTSPLVAAHRARSSTRRAGFERCGRLGPKAIVNRAVNGPFVRGAKADGCDVKPVAPPRAAGDRIRCGFVASVPAAA